MTALPRINFALSPRATLLYLLFFSVVMDIAYGMLSFYGAGAIKVSLLYRFSVLGAFLIIVLRRKDFDAWVLKGFFVAFMICQCIWVMSFGKTNLFLDFQYFTQALFPMVVGFIVFHALDKAQHQDQDLTPLVFSAIMAYGVVAACSLIFTLLTGIGKLTYGEWAFGYKSFFDGGNDIGLTLLVILCFAWSRFWQTGTFGSLFRVILITMSILIIGSRASYGGGAIITFIFAILFVLFKDSQRISTRVYKFIVIVVVLGSTALVVNFVLSNFENLVYQYERLSELLDGESPRATLQKAAWQVIERRDAINDMVGSGSNFVYQIYNEFYLSNRAPRWDVGPVTGIRLVEADFMDIFGIFGWLFGGAFVLYHLFYLIVAVHLYLKSKNIYYFAIFFSLCLFIAHGALAGHALMSAQVATPIGALYGFLRFKLKYPDKGKAF